MASNSTGLLDEDQDASDWIELYNAGSTTVNLAGMGLTDNPSNRFKWVFPSVQMPPNSFLLVWTSGKNRTDSILHTSISISASGEPLLLTTTQGQLIDSVGPVLLPIDIS